MIAKAESNRRLPLLGQPKRALGQDNISVPHLVMSIQVQRTVLLDGRLRPTPRLSANSIRFGHSPFRYVRFSRKPRQIAPGRSAVFRLYLFDGQIADVARQVPPHPDLARGAAVLQARDDKLRLGVVAQIYYGPVRPNFRASVVHLPVIFGKGFW